MTTALKPGRPIGISTSGDLFLPEDAVTQGFGILARRRSGKSNLGGVMEETFCDRGDPWVCLDPVSAHWGIRYLDAKGQPGKPSRYKVMIVGGKYGDVALDEKAGAALAQIIVDTDISCVIDLGDETMNASMKFVADFATELLRLNTTPRHVFLEEAHVFVPQQLVWDNQKAALGSLTKMITMGGGKGIGYTLITQKSSAVAKTVLEQIDNLFVLRMSGPRDLKAVTDWFEHNVSDKDELKRIVGSLPGFKPGQAWLLSPDWMHDLTELQVRERHTYHAGRTPKRGEAQVAPKRVELGEVIGKYRDAATKRQIAVREETDTKKELAATKAQLAVALRAAPKERPPAPCTHDQEIATMRRERDEARKVVVVLRKAMKMAREAAARAEKVIAGVGHELDLSDAIAEAEVTPIRAITPSQVGRRIERANPVDLATGGGPARAENGTESTSAASLSGPQQRILDALARLETVGLSPAPRKVVAVFADQSPKSSSYDNNLSAVRKPGLIENAAPGAIRLTEAGRALAAAVEVPPTLFALHTAWAERLSGPQQRIMYALIKRYPDDVDRPTLAEETDQSAISSSYDNNLSALRTLGILKNTQPKHVAATDLLFPEGLT